MSVRINDKWPGRTYVYCMLVCFEESSKDFPSFDTVFVYQTISDSQKQWKRDGHNFVKLFSSLTCPESVHSANGQQALDSGKN
jgi:hypothetical protein